MHTVAILFGGRSLEHDVSVVSGLQVLHAVDPAAYAPLPIYIDPTNRWWSGDSLWHSESFKGGGPDRSVLTEVTLATGFGKSLLEPVPGAFVLPGQAPTTPIDVFVPVL